ncbi:hypothetical protein ACFV6D_18015 [Kitasatospora sp. NPDC059812]|uniref:hypothetical protein n=1 Tax=Kitasatospora sp. NPDC059812 TaxID=3346958 RepID=UPI0036526CEE
MPTQRLGGFHAQADRARDLIGVGQSVAAMTANRIDGSDLYRAALVHAVAALDSYVHGVVLDRAVDILMMRTPAGGGNKVGLHFGAISQIVAAAENGPAEMEMVSRTYISERLGLETYQRPDDISKALAMVGVGKIWSAAFGKGATSRQTALGLIVSRRNRIVHECDLDPLNPGFITPLSADDAVSAVQAIRSIVAGIDSRC